MALEKPRRIALDPYMSEKWDELTEGRTFSKSNVSLLTALCRQYKNLEVIEEELEQLDGQLVYENSRGDLSDLPQYGMYAQAVTQIRMLEKHLGINTEAVAEPIKRKEAKLFVIQANRQSKASVARRA